MNVFDLDRALVSDYERFARSFTQIRALDIHRQVEALYASDRFWPEPLISINPRFERGATVDRLVADGSLHKATVRVFSADGNPLTLYRHQAQAVAKATTGQSFVVTIRPTPKAPRPRSPWRSRMPPDAASAHRNLHSAADRSLDRLSLQQRLKDIGRMDDAAAKAKEPN